MSNSELDDVLHEFYDLEVEHAPKKHYQQTPECPPLPSLVRAIRKGSESLSPRDRNHVATCEFCQKMTAMQWKVEHPSVWVVAQHLAGTLPDREAMRIHLEEDRCPYCRLLQKSVQKSVAVRAMVFAILAAKDAEETPRQLGDTGTTAEPSASHGLVTAGREAAGSRRGAKGLQPRFAEGFGGLAWAGEFAPETRGAFEIRAVTSDLRLIVTVREMEAGELKVFAESPDRTVAGRKVRVEVLGEGEPLTRELKLEDRGEFGSDAKPQSLGKIEQLGRFLEHCAVVAEWVEEKV